MNVILYICLLLIYTVFVLDGRRVRRISKREEEALEQAHRNAICCAKKMRCCLPPKPPPIEIRAILARCPNLGSDKTSVITRTMTKPLIAANEHSLRHFQGFDEDEPLIQSRVTKCRRKILMTLKMHHKGAVSCKNQYIVVDHVYDPVTEKSVRLLNPYVIKLKQQPVNKAFYLKFVDYVNSEAKEQVFNKQDANYTGCYTDKMHATCGIVKYEGKVIPYSEGFCCSCDLQKNQERQPASVNTKNEPIVSYSDPAFLLDRVQCPRNFYKDKDYEQEENQKNEHNKRSQENTSASPILQFPSITTGFPHFLTNATPTTAKRWQYTTYSRKAIEPSTTENSHKYLSESQKMKRDDWESLSVDKSLPRFENSQPVQYLKHLQIADRKKHPNEYIMDVKKAHVPDIPPALEEENPSERLLRKIRQTFPSGVQKRGGQNCANRFTPPGLDPEHYHESTHCLRFSDVWYGIYKLGRPYIEQTIDLNIYERFETESNPDKWREITNSTVHLGDKNPLYEDETPTISITLMTKSLSDKGTYDVLHTKRILIPEGIRPCDASRYPEMKNGADEYLVVKPDDIDIEGDQCNKIGVGFEAFYKQPERCAMPRGTCLQNQPKHLWRHDKSLERKNETGCYFLKYHANITRDPIIITPNGDKFLKVEYSGAYTTTVDIEIKADFNTIIRQQTTATITEVYVDSTCDKITTIIIKVINSGLISCQYMVQLSDFPLDIPDNMTHVKTKLALIAPQNQYIFTMQIRSPLPSEWFHCSVEVLNSNKELVALRRIRIQKYDRCICSWHCLCACVASSQGLKCIPMALEHYHAAGFQGSLPIVTHVVHFTLLDDLLSVTFYFALFLLGTLLVLGLSKALLGLCFYAVGIWGLGVLLDLPKRMKRYYEKDIKKEKVIYDDEGWPIHPTTQHRVRNISVSTQFCTNMVFFFTYPLACCLVIFRRLCCPYYTKQRKSPDKKIRISEDNLPKRHEGRKRRFYSSKDDTSNDSKSDGSSKTEETFEKNVSTKVESAPRKRFSLTPKLSEIISKATTTKVQSAPPQSQSASPTKEPTSSSSSKSKKCKASRKKNKKNKSSSSSSSSPRKNPQKGCCKSKPKPAKKDMTKTTTTAMYVQEHQGLPKFCSCTHPRPKVDERPIQSFQQKSKFSRVQTHYESEDSNESSDKYSCGDTVVIQQEEKVSTKANKCAPKKTKKVVHKETYKTGSDTRLKKRGCASACAKDTSVSQEANFGQIDSSKSNIQDTRKAQCYEAHSDCLCEEVTTESSLESDSSSSENSSYSSSDPKCLPSIKKTSKITKPTSPKAVKRKVSIPTNAADDGKSKKPCATPKKKVSKTKAQRSGSIFKRFSKSKRTCDDDKCDSSGKRQTPRKSDSKTSRNSLSKFLSIRKRSRDSKQSRTSVVGEKPLTEIFSKASISPSAEIDFQELEIKNLDDFQSENDCICEPKVVSPPKSKPVCYGKDTTKAKGKEKKCSPKKSDQPKSGYCASPKKPPEPSTSAKCSSPQGVDPMQQDYVEEMHIIRAKEKEDAKTKGTYCHPKKSKECSSPDKCPGASPQRGILSRRSEIRGLQNYPVQVYTAMADKKKVVLDDRVKASCVKKSTDSKRISRSSKQQDPKSLPREKIQDGPQCARDPKKLSPIRSSIQRPKSM